MRALCDRGFLQEVIHGPGDAFSKRDLGRPAGETAETRGVTHEIPAQDRGGTGRRLNVYQRWPGPGPFLDKRRDQLDGIQDPATGSRGDHVMASVQATDAWACRQKS